MRLCGGTERDEGFEFVLVKSFGVDFADNLLYLDFLFFLPLFCLPTHLLRLLLDLLHLVRKSILPGSVLPLQLITIRYDIDRTTTVDLQRPTHYFSIETASLSTATHILLAIDETSALIDHAFPAAADCYFIDGFAGSSDGVLGGGEGLEI